MQTTLFANRAVKGLILLTALALSAVHSEAATPVPLSPPSIDGTYELTERVMANGTVLRPPSIVALYTMADGRFSLNLFVKNADGTIASESSVGRICPPVSARAKRRFFRSAGRCAADPRPHRA
jgi:hypothetical protein